MIAKKESEKRKIARIKKQRNRFKIFAKKSVQEKTKSLKFPYNEYTIPEEGKKILNEISKTLKQFPDLRFSILGHTDNVGSLIYNTVLSFNRAEAVQKYLITKGISKENLIPKAYGFFNPLSDNKTETGRSQNRRVEIILENEQ